MYTLNTQYAALLRLWAYLHSIRRNEVQEDVYRQVCAELERIELGRTE